MEKEKSPKRFEISSDSWMYMVILGVILGIAFDMGISGYIIGAIIGWSLGFGGQEKKKEENDGNDEQCLNDLR